MASQFSLFSISNLSASAERGRSGTDRSGADRGGAEPAGVGLGDSVQATLRNRMGWDSISPTGRAGKGEREYGEGGVGEWTGS